MNQKLTATIPSTGKKRRLRHFERTINECHHNLRQVFPMRAGKTNG